MPRYFMRLAYRGAPFHGWQRQPNAISVQQLIEDALSMVLRHPVGIVGAGRTDAGVNARVMVAHFDSSELSVDINKLISSLNVILGPDIAIYGITPVHDDAHARFSAVSRTYHYYTVRHKSPFFYPLAWQEPAYGLDFRLMNKAAEHLLEVDDFTSFSKLHTDVKTNICKVTEAEWRAVGDEGHVFVITADRFLRNMVRAVVGTLVDVGRGKLSVDDFRRIIAEKNRCAAGVSMPGHALYLWDVRYPFDF